MRVDIHLPVLCQAIGAALNRRTSLPVCAATFIENLRKITGKFHKNPPGFAQPGGYADLHLMAYSVLLNILTPALKTRQERHTANEQTVNIPAAGSLGDDISFVTRAILLFQ